MSGQPPDNGHGVAPPSSNILWYEGLKKKEKDVRSVRSSIFLQPILSFSVIPLLQLEVLGDYQPSELRCKVEMTYSCMHRMASGSSLQKNEENSSNNRNEVQRKVHNVSDQCLWCELLEWGLHKLSKLCDWVIEVSRL